MRREPLPRWLDGTLLGLFVLAVCGFIAAVVYGFLYAVAGVVYLYQLAPGVFVSSTLVGGSWLIFRLKRRR